MAKQLNVSLNVQANTTQAKNAIMDLQASLSKISMGRIDGIDSTQMKQASAAAKELSIHLNNAYNSTTGNFDLSKLDRSLKTSKTNIQELSMQLLQAGASGEQAFVQLAQSIAAADRPMISLNSKLKEFGTTLANTARWQISSSILHGFMGAIQQAYGYSQDLNKSLNDIRIVTGQNADQMAVFAEKANKAAKSLSATTTEYTNASLIYYQQGLSNEEVQKRTDITIKMAHAAGESAESVSSYMTAIWNNFDDGTKSLEYYGDVITKLGAATAASSEEIAAGLEKFVSIGETVGLSYEYATAAVTTIVDKTRASADTVGTALKTIFARLQGLKLGETLEDGVDLNKYSTALEAVGVKVLDMSGNLRDADDIIKDLGETWNTLSRAQQTALAQTVAGTRQYTYLMALMKDFDSFEMNVDYAKNSEGTLQEQADIYAESWEAAKNRVQASLESIYKDLVDDSFFIDLSNGFASLLDSINGFIDGIGGVKGLLVGIGSFFLAGVANKIQPALMNLKHSFTVVFSTAAEQARMLSGEMNAVVEKQLNSEIGASFSDSTKVALQNTMALNEAKAKLSVVDKDLNNNEKQRFSQEMAMIELQQKETQEVANRITKLKQEREAILDKVETTLLNDNGIDTAKKGGKEVSGIAESYRQAMHEVNTEEGSSGGIEYAIESYMRAKDAVAQYQDTQSILIESTAQVDNFFRQIGDSLDLSNPIGQIDQLNNTIQNAFGGAIDDLRSRLSANSMVIDENAASFTSFQNQIELVIASMPSVVRESEAMNEALVALFQAQDSKGLEQALALVEKALKGSKIEAKDFANILKEVNPKRFKDLEKNSKDLEKELERLKKKQEAVNRAVNEFNPQHTVSKIEAITKTAAGLGQVAMAAQSARAIFDAWNNDDLSIGEKITTSLMSISMLVPSVINGLKSLNSAMGITQGVQLALALSAQTYAAKNWDVVASMTAEQAAKKFKISMDQAELVLMQAKTRAAYAEIYGITSKTGAMTAEQLVEKTGMTIDQASIIVKKMKEKATMEEAFAAAGLLPVKGANIVATITETAAYSALVTVMSPVAAITLIIVAALASLVIVIGAVVLGIKAMVDWYNKDADAAKAAEEQVKSLTTQFEECKSAAEELKTTISNWEDGISALEKLDKKSEEYKQKLKEVNDQAKELIETYGLYDKYTVEDGVITFNPGVLEGLQNEKDKEANRVETQLYAAKMISNNANVKSQGTNLGRDIGSLYDAQASEIAMQSGGGPVYRTASSSEMQQMANALDSLVTVVDGEEIALDVEQVRKALESGVSGLPTIISDNLSNLSDEDIQAIIDFRNSMNEATDANKYYAKQIIGNQIEEKYGESYRAATQTGQLDENGNSITNEALYNEMLAAGEAYGSGLKNSAGKTLDQLIGEIDVSGVDSNADLNKMGFEISNDKDLGETYAREVLGWSDKDISYSGGTGKGTLTNATTGKEMTLDDNFMRQALARQKKVNEVIAQFEQETGTSMQDFNNAITTMVASTTEETANILLDAVQNTEAEGSAKIDFNAFMAEISPEDLAQYQGLSQEELLAKLQIDPGQLEKLGLGNGEAFFNGFQQAMNNYDPEAYFKNMEQRAQATIAAGAQELDMTEAALEAYTEDLMENNEELKNNKALAAECAVESARFSIGLDKLQKATSDYSSTIRKAEKDSLDYYEAVGEVQTALEEAFGVDVDADFIEENLELIEKAATGDIEAVEDLRIALSQDLLCEVMAVDNFSDLDPKLQELSTKIGEYSQNEIKIGATIEGEDEFLTAAQGLVDVAGMTVEEAQEYFNSLGYEPEFETQVETVTQSVPQTRTHTDYAITWGTIDIAGTEWPLPTIDRIETSSVDGYKEVDTAIETPLISADGTPKLKSLKKTGGGAPVKSNKGGGDKKASGGGGSKSKSKKAEKSKKSDIVERYKEINDALKETQRLMSKNELEAEGLWGNARFKKMKEAVKLLKQENAQLKERMKWSQGYFEEDKAALQDAAKEAGITLQFDSETNNIVNYTVEMEKLYKDLKSIEEAANADGDVSEEEQEQIDEAQKKIENIKKAKDEYEKTLDQMRSDEEEYLANQNEIWTKNFEELNDRLELRIDINESDLAILEYYLGKIEDDAYASTEAFGLYSKEVLAYTDNLHAQEDYYAELRQQLEAGEISMAQYKEGLQQAQSDTLANAEALRELKIEMQDYYGNVIAQSVEDLALYTDQMEHLNSVLDHYSSIMDIVGKQQDYETKGKILSGKANNIRNELDAYKKEYEMYNAEAEEWKKKMDSAAAGSNEYETYKKNWIAAQEAANNAQDNMLSKTEEWAEAMRACVENELDGLAKELEENLTGGTSFDTMLTAMERANSLQEEYLTTTNKIYETSKLMNQAQQEIDKTNNSVAKRKLKGFIEETDQLQKQGKLSQFELEIQQAKYDLLLAEIALEEAQQAKSTVRLQRDSEGNFGYVYTADSNQIAEAEQKLADAQNSLYNIGLEGANDYNQKYAETMQEMYDTLTDLQKQYLEGSFTTEQEYQDAVTAAKEYYYAKLEDYSALHTVALSTDSRIVADAWSSDFNDMMGKTEEWKNYIDEYSISAAESLSTWAEVVSTVLEDSGLDDVDSAVNDITVESNNLKDAIIGEDGNGGLVAALQSEIAEAGRLSEEYITLQDEIDKTIAAHEKLAEELNKEFKNPTATEDGSGSDDEGSGSGSGSGDGGSGSGSGSGDGGSGSGGNDEGDGSDSSSGGDGTVSVGDEVTYTGGYYYNTSQGDDPKGNRGPNKKVKVTRVLTNGAPYPIAVESSDSAYGWLKKEQLSGFDTGGYTGAWGSYGKMAMLHEKELVLNKQDTENFLTSMEFLDNIIKTIDLQAANSALGGLLSSPSFGDFGQKEILEQNVKIEASFPNVQNRTEIEEAFETLINRASQYANRK